MVVAKCRILNYNVYMSDLYNKNSKTKMLAIYALFAAMTMVMTMLSIPIPSGGYIHLGDAIIYTCAWMIGGVGGAIAVALGSVLADVTLGYPQYAIATLVIKFLMCYIGYTIMKILPNKFYTNIIAILVGSAIMIAGYSLFEWMLTGVGGAIAVLPGNIVQAAAGLVISLVLISTIGKIEGLKQYKWKKGAKK